MASGRRGRLPIFKVTHDQLEAKVCERLTRQGRGADTQESQKVKDGVNSSKCDLDVHHDHDFQIKPITKPAAVLAPHQMPCGEFEDQKSFKRSANRGRGHKKSPDSDQFNKLKLSARTSRGTSTLSTNDIDMPVSMAQVKGSTRALATGSVGKEELVRIWKSYSSGKVERALCVSGRMSNWIQEPVSLV